MADAGRATALTAWRTGGKNVLQYHKEVLMTLWDTPLEGAIPTDVLLHFPFWCAYIPFPYPEVSVDLWGMFVHLQWNHHAEKPELWLNVHFTPNDSDIDPLGSLTPLILDIDRAVSVEEAVDASYRKAAANLPPKSKLREGERDIRETINSIQVVFKRTLSVVLYVCAENARMTPMGEPTSRPHVEKGKKIFAPNKPNEWQVAYRIGAAISAAKQAVKKAESTPTGREMRPHLRRAHWHTFRRGVGRLETVLHWLPPIPVNMPEDVDASEWAALLPTTVRPVRGKTS